MIAIFCSGLAGCVEPTVHDTPSGRPEVTLSTKNHDAVRSALINRMLNKGYSITRDTGHSIAFDRPVDNALGAVLFGSQYDATPNARIVYTLAALGNATRVVADIAIVTNPGSAFERQTNMNGNQDSLQVQAMLESLKGDNR